jgi:hypothetical protein
MRQAVAALVSAKALASKEEAVSRTPALPDEPPGPTVARRRHLLLWTSLPSVWETTHAGG